MQELDDPVVLALDLKFLEIRLEAIEEAHTARMPKIARPAPARQRTRLFADLTAIRGLAACAVGRSLATRQPTRSSARVATSAVNRGLRRVDVG